MKKLALMLVMFLSVCATSFAQMMEAPVKWSGKAVCIEGDTYEILLEGTIDDGWHMYDFGPYQDGPVTAAIALESDNNAFNLVGSPYIKTDIHKEYDEVFEMELGYCEGRMVIAQKIVLTTDKPSKLIAAIEGQACKEGMCMLIDDSVEISLPAGSGKVAAAPAAEITDGSDVEKSGSIWAMIIEAIIWGFVALLTPCVFPMVPMTVSFFLKNSQGEGSSKARGKMMATFYGLSIIALYTLPIAIIILITYFAGGEAVTADIFNWLATHWIPNILFFIIFMVFAASFFGAFEITLPSWMVNKSDAKSDKGGLVGVFFMALTLVLVSFSCTGPIVGTVLIKSTQGEFWEPIITMLAFSAAFALPFTVFAFMPSLLKDLPKSGGWLNSVKVVLGFVEVALGFKFLSVADQTYHWGLLDREVYLAIWIVVFSLMGLYLLGKIRFAHDTPTEHLTVKRLVLSIVVFTFVVYMIPGMFGAPLKALSGYLPPISTQDFVLSAGGTASSSSSSDAHAASVKYGDKLHMPFGIHGYFDYEEGRQAAIKAGKPIFLDFTGHGCVNCREMEARVWSDPAVLNMLKEDFIVIALYADDKMNVPESDWVTTENGKVLKSLGKINSHFMQQRFNANAQPFYNIIDPETDETLVAPRGYDLDPVAFAEFLKAGLENYRK